MTYRRFILEKLIRDHLPLKMEEIGILLHQRTMKEDEFILALKEKLLEEAEEVKQACQKKDLIEELADMLEIIHSISAASGLTMRQIEEKRIKKREMNGGFDKRIYAHCIDIEEGNAAISSFLGPAKEAEDPVKEQLADCLFCQILLNERKASILANFTHCFAIKDEFPVSKGHVLIIPKEHIEHWFTAREEVRLDIIRALHLMKERIDLEFDPQGYNLGANCGEAAGQTIMHLHLHLIPRYKGDMDHPKGGVRGVIPSKQHY